MVQLGILLALASAFIANLGLLCKYRGAMAAPTVELKHPLRSGAGLFRSRWWLIGFAVATVGWTFHVAALSVAPLSLVETTLSGGILLLAWIAERWFGVKVGPREWIGVGLCAIGLVLLALTSAGHGGASSKYSVEAMASFEAAAVGVGTALLLSGSAGVPGRASGPFLGIAAGLMLGVANVAVKALTGTVPGDPLAILVSPWAFTALVAGVGAFLALGRGLQTGGAIPVITLSSVTANLVSVAGGIAVFGDPMGTDPLAIAARSIAFAAVIAAAIVLPAPGQAAAARA
jgi:multidrug transporter EmrE-like cation transporter